MFRKQVSYNRLMTEKKRKQNNNGQRSICNKNRNNYTDYKQLLRLKY